MHGVPLEHSACHVCTCMLALAVCMKIYCVELLNMHCHRHEKHEAYYTLDVGVHTSGPACLACYNVVYCRVDPAHSEVVHLVAPGITCT